MVVHWFLTLPSLLFIFTLFSTSGLLHIVLVLPHLFLSDEGGDNDSDGDGGNSREKDKDKDKEKDSVAAHLLTKTAKQVDKVANEDKANRGNIEEHCSMVLAVPNIAVLPA